MSRCAAAWLWALVLVACAPSSDAHSSPSPAVGATRWRYEARLGAALRRFEVRVCFEGPAPMELRPGIDAASIYLHRARWLGPGPVHTLHLRRGKLQLSGAPDDGCLEYEIDLERAVGQSVKLAQRLGDDLLASPDLWLWRPERRSASCQASLTLELPPGTDAALPWSARGERYSLTARDFRFQAQAAFGSLRPRDLSMHGITLRVRTLGDGPDATNPAVQDWLRSAARAVADWPGGFVTPHVQVLLAHVGARETAVPFGSVARSGEGSLLLFVSESAAPDTLSRDWKAVHELSHLYLPYVDRRDAWLAEGLATYHQEVLRVRAGLQSERAAWQTFSDAFARHAGQDTGRSLAEESAAVARTHQHERVYWAGAAFALMADAALRHESGGRESLASAIAGAAFGQEPSRSWRADEVLAALDQAAQTTRLSELAASCLSRDFPNVAPWLSRLGVETDEHGQVTLNEDAPWAAVRRKLVTRSAAPRPPHTPPTAQPRARTP